MSAIKKSPVEKKASVKNSIFERVLVVDDEENIRHLLGTVLKQQGWEVSLASNGKEALDALKQSNKFDVLLSDIRMPEMSGLDLLQKALAIDPELVVVMMSAYGSVDTALEAMKQGAYDYIAKPFKPDEVILVLRKAEERERLKKENQKLRLDLAKIQTPGLENMLAKSEVMQELFKTIRKISEYKTTILIQGESGTGKELVARAVHACSPRASFSFVPINCGAIPENLLESELFGHRKGAFTDATRDKIGLLEEANGGTLFLDEIGELPLNLQVKILRFLQEEEIRRVGDTRGSKVDVRVVAATIRDLQKDVSTGRFREDLFYRLNVVPLTLPPLRHRMEDVPLLMRHFLAQNNIRLGTQINDVDPEAMRLLMEYSWPGNVRELENTIEHAMVLADGETLGPQNLPIKIRENKDPIRETLESGDLSIKKSMRVIEEELIRRALKQTKGNRTAACKILEISHRALLYKIKAYDISDL